MADTAREQVLPNSTETENNAAVNETVKIPATPEGMAVAYISLFLMAIIPIYIGSFRSVTYHKEQKESGEKPETMSHKDAAMFPIIASCALFGIYLVFQDWTLSVALLQDQGLIGQKGGNSGFKEHIFSKEHINLLLTTYFFFLGVLALTHIAGPIISKLLVSSFPNMEYHFILKQGRGEKKEDVMNYEFDRKDLVSLAFCGVIGIWYLWQKHWLANNLFGIAFAINGVELLSLNRVSTGCILLGGLFIYDIFWVFGTNVMVTVAKSFEAPIKLVFPQDLLENGLAAKNFAMLGLGDIVIPGIFIALLLRFDMSLKRKSTVYFYAGFVAYCLGLGLTMFILHFFKHAQPALLYLVPCCLGLPTLLATIKGDFKVMFDYEDHSETPTPKKEPQKIQ